MGKRALRASESRQQRSHIRDKRRALFPMSVCALMSGLLLAACGSSASNAAGSGSNTTTKPAGSSGAATAPPYTINAILPLTGPDSFLGKRESQALAIFAKKVNQEGGIDGHKLVFKVADNTSVPSVAVSLASGTLSKGAPVLLDGTSVTTDAPVDALVTSSGPVIYELTPAISPKPGSFIFSTDTSLPAECQASVQFVAGKNWTRVAAITSTDASGVVAWKDATTALSAPGISGKLHVVSHQTFAPNAVSVTTQLSSIKASNPQVIFAYATGPSVGVVFKGMQELGIENIPVMLVASEQSYALMHAFGPTVPSSVYVPGMVLQPSVLPKAEQTPLTNFETAVSAAGLRPDVAEALAWDPASIVVSALKHLGTTATASQIKDYIQNLKTFTGAFGTYQFSQSDHRGLSLNEVRIETYNSAQQGSWATVSGPGGAPTGS